MLKLLKLSPAIAYLSWLAACTPIPEPPRERIAPRPVAPLPVETMTPQAPQTRPPGQAKPTKPTKPGTTKAKPVVLSANEVKVRLQQAEDRAIRAANLRQSAQTKEDWNLVINQLQQAIALLKQIPPASPQKAIVQQRLAEYQSNLAQVQQLATSPAPIIQPPDAPRKGGRPLIIVPDASPSPSPSPTTTPSPTESPTPVK
jgi:hypothetical protein